MTDSYQLGFSGMSPAETSEAHARQVLAGAAELCPWPPTELQRAILRELLFHQGAHLALPLRDLMAKLQRVTHELPTEREIKDAVRGLVVDFRVRIGASRQKPFGYYLITTSTEARAAAQAYIEEIRELARRVRVILDPHDLAELAGQISLTEEEKSA